MNTTAKRVIQLLNRNNLVTATIEETEKFHHFSIGVEGHDDITFNLYFVENEDNDIITFCSPCIYEYGDDDFVATLNGMNEMSVHNPFVKPVIVGENSIWLYYDHKLFNEEITIEMLQYMISSLVSFGLNLLNKIEEYKAKTD